MKILGTGLRQLLQVSQSRLQTLARSLAHQAMMTTPCSWRWWVQFSQGALLGRGAVAQDGRRQAGFLIPDDPAPRLAWRG